MDVLILAAGRGERMRPLTDRVPKPLLAVGETSLIERHITNLVAAGHRRLVINHAHLGEQITRALGNGGRYGASITYSPEPPGALETGGGIVQALPRLHGDWFAVVNGDIWTDFPFDQLPPAPGCSAWLVLVDNPPQHQAGDFVLEDGRVYPRDAAPERTQTFAGIAVYHRRLFEDLAHGRYPLLPILRAAIDRGEVEGCHYRGRWADVGTPERLEALRASLAEP